MTCAFCGAAIETDHVVCTACGGPLARRPMAKEPAPETRAGAELDTETRGEMPPTPVSPPPDRPTPDARECSHAGNAPGAVICLACGQPLSITTAPSPTIPLGPRIVLVLPWGEHLLAPGRTLDVGREVGPFERPLEPYMTVGRRHATLRVTQDGVLLVRDNGSLNGTFVDGRRCAPTGEVEVRDGSELRFSSAVRVLVRVER